MSKDGIELLLVEDNPSDEELTLITCGGAFDSSIHMYVSRWVVRATRDAGAPASAD